MLRSANPLRDSRPIVSAIVVYVITSCVFALVSASELWHSHTAYNHFALLAESWLQGRLDLPGPPPLYAGGNDFAFYGNRWFVVFPPAPAVLLLPWVAIARGAAGTQDGLFFLGLAGVAPAGMFLTLERVRKEGWAPLRCDTVWILTALYAFGTVYFFTAVQGTVWFAAHVVAAAATAFFLFSAIGARFPVGAGIALAVAVGTRPVLGALGLFFVLEWWRVERGRIGKRSLLALVCFGLPVAITIAALGYHNWARFGNATEFGYRYLTVAWQARIEKWGLFSYHYLARNLGLLLTSLPYVEHDLHGWKFQINGHGLALWITTPAFLWLLWPRHQSALHRAIYPTLLLVALPSLLYQNSGWVQFGQRFSNDYAPLLVLLLALGGYAWSRALRLAVAFSVLVNSFGAVTFGRPEFARYYFIERTQRVIYQPD